MGLDKRDDDGFRLLPNGQVAQVIIESAGKVKAITKYLGRGFRVMPSFGHVRDLATGKDKSVKEEVSGIQIANGWKMRYLVDAGSKSKNAKGRDR